MSENNKIIADNLCNTLEHKTKKEAVRYLLKNRETEEEVMMTLSEILEEINRDRSEEWTLYNESDWKEGLREFTEFDLV